MAVLVTGAKGFIGAALAPALECAGFKVVCASRLFHGDIGPDTDWRGLLSGVDTVVHLAGIAHVRAKETDLARVNIEGVRALAAQSAAGGVKRFVFLSSVLARHDTSYGRSKRTAEQVLCAMENLKVVSLRPPLVIGAGAKAKAHLLLRLADTSMPMPIGQFRSKRSYIALSTLVSAIQHVVAKPDGPSGVFEIANRPSLTIGELVADLRAGLRRPARVFAAPLPGPSQLSAPLEVDDAAFVRSYGYGDTRDAHEALGDAARSWKAARS